MNGNVAVAKVNQHTALIDVTDHVATVTDRLDAYVGGALLTGENGWSSDRIHKI